MGTFILDIFNSGLLTFTPFYVLIASIVLGFILLKIIKKSNNQTIKPFRILAIFLIVAGFILLGLLVFFFVGVENTTLSPTMGFT